MSNSRFSTPKSSSSSSSFLSSPPSSSMFSLPSSDEDSLPFQKFACILVQGRVGLEQGYRMGLEWYVFNISDDVEHNQAPPPPGPSPFLQAIFHPNSHEQQHIKPAVIGPSERNCCVLGSNNTLYVSGRDDLVSCFDLTNTKKSRQEFLPPMPNDVLSAHALFLGNKLYCLGGYQENKPWAMAYDLILDRWDSLVDPPHCSKRVDNIFSVAIEVPTPTIVVGSTLQPRPLQIYDVHTKCWRLHEFINKDGFYLFPRGQPVAVDSKFYWYEFNYQCLAAFDVVTNEWSLGYVPIHDSDQCLLDGEIDSPPRLAHLAGDYFCLFWGSPCQHYEPGGPLDSITSRLHCLKFRISKVHPKQGSTFRLDASILSCQSYVVPWVKTFLDGFVGDGHLDLGYNCLEV
ncbi:uncharacterized protein LOC112018956 [Quercus suber]|uniref:uncharacterized protein LOC112018956 n=1 Tax=Quercus suber TaxID=58331 RepID=UPI0032E0169A